MDWHEQDGSGLTRSAQTICGAGVGAFVGLFGAILADRTEGFKPLLIIVVVGMLGAFIGYRVGHDSQGDKAANRKTVTARTFGTKDHLKRQMVIEVVSSIIVILTIVGLIVGVMIPGKVTGAIFPLALASWFILYGVLDRN